MKLVVVGVAEEEEQPAMNPRGIGREKMGLAGKKKKGVSSDTTDCSLFLLPATEWRTEDWGEEEEEEDDWTEEHRKDGEDWGEVRRAWDRARVSAHLSLSSSKWGHVQGYRRRSWLVAPLPPLPPPLISSIWRTKWLQFALLLLFSSSLYLGFMWKTKDWRKRRRRIGRTAELEKVAFQSINYLFAAFSK